jgi:hypothetical protein
MTDPDPELAEHLRRSAEARIQAQIQTVRQRAEQQREGRARFKASRDTGLKARYAAKIARTNLINRHQDQSMTCTELAECPGDVQHQSREWHHPEHRDRPELGITCWCLAGDPAPRVDAPSRDSLF